MSGWKAAILGSLAGVLILAIMGFGWLVMQSGGFGDAVDPLADAPRQSASRELESPQPRFTRRPDGGAFQSGQELFEVFELVGLKCVDEKIVDRTPEEGADIGECWTGAGNVTFIVDESATSPERLQMSFITSRNYVYGQNWAVKSETDPAFIVEVKDRIGGIYHRK